MALPADAPAKVPPRAAEAAALLERAAQSSNDPNVQYMLALAYKRQGKANEARAVLRKIQKPDANVFLQLALLSLAEDNLPLAEEELGRSWSMDPTCYETCYNLLLVRLTLGKVEGCLELMPKAQELAEKRGDLEERRFLAVLHALLRLCQAKEGQRPDPLLAEITEADEARLLKVIRSLGQLDTVHLLLKTLAEARPRSPKVREAYVESVLVKGKTLIDRCHWTEAEVLLRGFVRDRSFSRQSQVALLTLLGCCAALTQDFDSALTHFNAALKLSPGDPRLHQNMAITYELQDDLQQADPHWNRFFDLFDKEGPSPRDIPRYRDSLLFESMTRLSDKYRDKEKWNSAVSYMQRATQVRGDDAEALERLFHLFNMAKRPQDARRTLDQLCRMRPDEPRYELYELDLVEVKGLGDIERLLSDIEKIRRRHSGNEAVEDRASRMANDIVPVVENICNQLTDNLGKVADQVRNLPNYQINWAAVREVMRDLMKEFQKLKRILGKCASLAGSEELRRHIRDLADHIERKIDHCRSMGA
ncbi:MAG: tetratricopeptide repeat protein [Gemmataceae bacterium]|nr:tetratricopeptide repeat protein [Gemmataceae bacterium]